MDKAENMAREMGFPDSAVKEAADYFMKFYKLFIDSDASLIEINPLAEDSTGDGEMFIYFLY